MGEYAGVLPWKFISFHCFENESNEPKKNNAERTGNFPDLPERSESKFVVVEETETSPSKSLAVLQVVGAEESTVKGDENTSEERAVISSQECLMSSSDD